MNITLQRACDIFGNAKPPREVWERQFDYCDEEFKQLCATPLDRIESNDLWYYYHNLSYSELQPEVFAYLFPRCLMEWHESLMRNEACGAGDAEFHYSILQGRIFETMMTGEQREQVYRFFIDSFLTRLDQERGWVIKGEKTPVFCWTARLNSLAIVMPRIDALWGEWFPVSTPGRAFAAVEYLASLIYEPADNPFFPPLIPGRTISVFLLTNHDSHIIDAGWMEENLRFLRSVLTYRFVVETLNDAAAILREEPEYPTVAQCTEDVQSRRDLVEFHIELMFEVL